MLEERGVELDHTTLYRWVQHYAPELQKRLKWFTKSAFHLSWRVDETYIKVKGKCKWAYLYRAVDKGADTIDFYLSPTRNAKAAKRFSGKALAQRKEWEKPRVINTDKAAAYGVAIQELKTEGKLSKDTEHRQVKYLNNVVEADHGKLKRLIKPTLGFTLMPPFKALKPCMRPLKRTGTGLSVLTGHPGRNPSGRTVLPLGTEPHGGTN